MSPDNELIESPRILYYNPMLDPYVQAKKFTPAMLEAVEDGRYLLTTGGGPLMEPNEGHPFNLVSSLCEDGLHRPALDWDTETPDPKVLSDYFSRWTSMISLIRSTNNWHIYVPGVAFTWGEYQLVLDDMVELDIIEPAYLAHSLQRGQTLLRPPHIQKLGFKPSRK